MIGTIIGAIVAGLIIGALARLVLPGKQNISILVTIVLGILGSLIGSWLVYQIGYDNDNGGFEIIPFLVGVVVAAILIVIYGSVTGRGRRPAERARRFVGGPTAHADVQDGRPVVEDRGVLLRRCPDLPRRRRRWAGRPDGHGAPGGLPRRPRRHVSVADAALPDT